MTQPLVHRWRFWAGLLTLCGSASAAGATDLLQSYQAALSGNVELKAARFAAEAGLEDAPIARSQLLPRLSLEHSQYRNQLSSRTPGMPAGDAQTYGSSTSALVLRQALYQPAAWAGYRRSLATGELAQATLAQTRLDVSLQVGKAYFDLLLAREKRLQLQTQLRVIGTQLQAAQRSLAAGQGTRTDVDEAQAQLDLTAAQEMAARDGIDQARQALETLTQQPVSRISPLDLSALQLLPPETDDLAHWQRQAQARHPALAALGASLQARQAELEGAGAGHLPSVELVAQQTRNDRDSITSAGSTYRNTQLGVVLKVPLYAGGAVTAQIRKAAAQLGEAEQKLQAGQHQLRDDVQRAFQAVRQGVLLVKALEQAERSAQQAVVASERGFGAGTRTRLDILNAQQQLGKASLDLASERFNHLLAQLRLHALSGSLDETVLRRINGFLSPRAVALTDAAAGVAPSP